MFTKPNPKQQFSQMEKDILAFWKEKGIFKKSLEKNTEKSFTFFDGPPFATGMPHYGHLVPSTLKDIFPRYWTMKGYQVERRWGWDCHGLPVEYEKEKELGLSTKQELEDYGIAKFNEACRSTVLKYAEDWRGYIERIGRWVDMDYDYKTMEPWYMESIWWIFKQLWKKGLVYEGEKIVPYCIRCATALSNFESSQGYADRQDPTVTVKFKAKNLQFKDNTPIYFMAWTTTPWTLPSNLALVVGPEVEYALVKDFTDNNYYILAKDCLSKFYKEPEEGEEAQFSVENIYMGSDLVGIRYEPLFPFFEKKSEDGAFKVYDGDFVTTTDGTGIVHMAPFGEDDHRILTENRIGIVNSVDESGQFTEEVTDYKGLTIFEANKEIIQDLKNKGLLVKQETMNHSYPHCWRCDSPLIYKPISTWFVEVTAMKDDLLSNNKKINWVPESMKFGRFGKWLENVRDWAISRNRYWGTPLPVWRCSDCSSTHAIGSRDEIFEKAPGRLTKVMVMRHGFGEHNEKGIWSCTEPGYGLTEKGKEQVKASAKKSLDHVNCIYTSPLRRTHETASIAQKTLTEQPELLTDERLKERQYGEWNEVSFNDPKVKQQLEDWHNAYFADGSHWYTSRTTGEETNADMEKRIRPFIEELLEKHRGQSVLIVTHAGPCKVIEKILRDLEGREVNSIQKQNPSQIKSYYIDTETGKEFDLHKHHVDNIKMSCDECGGESERITEVFDCWFESGSMPYAHNHYPFEHAEKTQKRFPADFIAEGQDQTRGWFYTLHVLATALTNDEKSGLGLYKPAAKNIVTTGMVLAEDGKKMSKRLKNYPDIGYVIEQYGADALRFYLSNSPVVQAQDIRFSEKGVEEVVKSLLLPLWNSYCFFVTYANLDGWTLDKKKLAKKYIEHPLDQWILSELHQFIAAYTEKLEAYEVNFATDLVRDFVDKMTNWYIRRSRRRFWKSENDGDKMAAYTTLHEVLTTFCQLLAPVCPFITDEIYKNLTNKAESVHLSEFPQVDEKWIQKDLSDEIAWTRRIIKLGHSIRAHEKVKVRQPLGSLHVGLPEGVDASLFDNQLDVIMEELNVKHVEFVSDPSELGTPIARPDARLLGPKYGGEVQHIIREAKQGNFEKLANGNIKVLNFELLPGEVEIGYESKEGVSAESEQGVVVALDVTITSELKQEGVARELVRIIQEMRKEADFQVQDRIEVHIHFANDPFIIEAIEAFDGYIKKETLATHLHVGHKQPEGFSLVKEVELEDTMITIGLKKQ